MTGRQERYAGNCISFLLRSKQDVEIRPQRKLAACLSISQSKTIAMKKLFIALLLLLSAASAKAALFITNNTNCIMVVLIYAHDQNHGTCGLESGRLQLDPGASTAFNNVATINTTLPFWQNGQTATTAGGTAVWGWDAAIVTNGGTMWAQIGNPGSCFPTASVTTPNACDANSVTADWTILGSNTFIDIR